MEINQKKLLIKEMTEEIQKYEANRNLILEDIANLTALFFDTQKKLQDLATKAGYLRKDIISMEREIEKLVDKDSF